MHNRQEETERFANIEQIEALHLKYIALARVAKEKGDGVLSESHYQRAEYYLHAINEQGFSLPVATVTATARSSVKASHPTKKILKDFNLERIYRKDPSNTCEKPLQESNVLPIRGRYLRRNRRGTQGRGIPE